ncbi:hypothetical protein EXIGLDRAFT_706716 [Exidia glandulosa HHB12029]|uniref:Uncharacterized protein n=1 Tax=Exidia glandulosa HHB12029 TaxID=1314781 RepID=A0A165Z5U9_EXIGL|nr:hypothetical protein EXIGLDRAFT_706716 [Exidia glandulosa HHB12029]
MTAVFSDLGLIAYSWGRFVPPSRLVLGFNSSGLMGCIKYIKGEIVTSSTGTVDILFDDGYKTDESLILMALMSNEILAQGTRKEVYKLKACPSMLAAKCFKNVNDEDAVVSHDDNCIAIFGEIMNICAGQWLLNSFFNDAKRANVEVHTSQAVYTDMQASLGPINGLDGWHLFDPMRHTAQGYTIIDAGQGRYCR